MALREYTQPVTSPADPKLPGAFPSLPDEVVKRFPEVAKYHEDSTRWWRKVRAAIGDMQEETLRDIVIKTDTATNNLRSEYQAADATLTATFNEAITVLTTADAALASRTTTLESQVQTPTTGLLARVTTVETTYATQTFAEAKKTEAISASTAYTDAEVSEEATARVTADTALGNRTTTLESQVQTPTTGLLARVTTVETTYATQTFAEAKKTEAISASATYTDSSVSTEATARSSADSALSSRATTLEAQMANTSASGLQSRISTEETARANADSTLSSRITTLESQVQTPTTGLLARVNTIETTYATDSEVSASIASVTSAYQAADAKKITVQGTAPGSPNVNDLWIDTADNNKAKFWDGSAWQYRQDGVLSAAVTTEQSARVAADGAIHARWGVNIDVNGRIAGRINLNGTNASSTFLVAVDKFVVENANGTVTLLDIRSGGKIVFGADVQSDNFAAGSAGWRVERNSGNAEFNNVTVRGTIKAGTTVEAGVIPTGNEADVGGGGSASSSSYTNLSPDLAITYSFDGTARCIEYNNAYIANASGSPQTCYVAIVDGSGSVVAELANGNGLLLDASESAPVSLKAYVSPSAGSHTYRIRVKGSAGASVASGGELSIAR